MKSIKLPEKAVEDLNRPEIFHFKLNPTKSKPPTICSYDVIFNNREPREFKFKIEYLADLKYRNLPYNITDTVSTTFVVNYIRKVIQEIVMKFTGWNVQRINAQVFGRLTFADGDEVVMEHEIKLNNLQHVLFKKLLTDCEKMLTNYLTSVNFLSDYLVFDDKIARSESGKERIQRYSLLHEPGSKSFYQPEKPKGQRSNWIFFKILNGPRVEKELRLHRYDKTILQAALADDWNKCLDRKHYDFLADQDKIRYKKELKEYQYT